jgi:hypothetical protein
VDRALSPGRQNCDSPTPSHAGECVPPPPGSGGRAHSLAGERVGHGGPNSNEGTDTVVLLVYMYFVAIAE